MKKLYLIIICIISLVIGINVYALEPINLYSPNYIVYDMDEDKIVLKNNTDSVTAIASLTKIMTTILSIENINDLDKSIVYSKDMEVGIDWDASRAGLILGESYTYRDLLYASMLPSGADATNALAVSLYGSVPNFVEKMNEKARELGMINTNYVNVTGLDRDNHVSSIDDVFILLKYALKNDLFKTIYTTKSYNLTNKLNKKNKLEDPTLVESTVLKTGKKLGLDISRIKGSKTGYTDNAGLCISFIFESNGHNYLAITTKAPYVYNGNYNVKDAINIINYFDSSFKNEVLLEKDTLVTKLDTMYSKEDNIEVKTSKDVIKYLPIDYDKTKFEYKYEGITLVHFNTKENTKLGVIKYYYDNNLIDEEEVILTNKLDFSVYKFYEKNKLVIIGFGVGTLLLLMLLIIIIKKLIKKR